VIRIRPPIKRELSAPRGYQQCAIVDDSQKSITLTDNYSCNGGLYNNHTFTFDHVYTPNDSQVDVYENTAKGAVCSALQGYNATVMAYGQTGSGKTYTMEGLSGKFRGIIPRAIEDIFNFIKECMGPTMRFLVRASYLQIYNECISDLLKPKRNNLAIRESKRRGLYVEGLSEWVVKSPQEIFGLIKRGTQVRATSATRLNAVSSRSHAIFQIIVEQNKIEMDANSEGDETQNVKQLFKVGKLNLVDLAGSERVRISGATGQRLEESKSINQSLSALGNVIAALTDKRKSRTHIPYRDSKLTRILEDSLGGNCKTTMMAMISPALEAFSESISTLKFANRAKHITNSATINEDVDEKALLRRYEREVKRLRKELAERDKNVVEKRRFLELEEQRQQAELDKAKALNNLEKLSHDLMREKNERKRLQQQIENMNNQLVGGAFDEHLRSLLLREQEKIRRHYEKKLHEIESEREQIEEEKAQSDRYKQLLIKQRDIMIQLTARLNERDQTILALQDELDSYEKQQRMLEDTLDQKTLSLVRLQKEANGQALSREVPEQAMYAPHGSQMVEEGMPGVKLLNAEEKIRELTKVIEGKDELQSGLSSQLEETQAEKVSLEYLLREKLEKMVQKEIEERVRIMEEEALKWRSKYEEVVSRQSNANYTIELSDGGEKSTELQEKFRACMEQESDRIANDYQHLVESLKKNLQMKEAELAQTLEYQKLLKRDPARQTAKLSAFEKERRSLAFLLDHAFLDHVNNLAKDIMSMEDVPILAEKRIKALKTLVINTTNSLNKQVDIAI